MTPERFTLDSIDAASCIYEDCIERGQSHLEAMRKSVGRLVELPGSTVDDSSTKTPPPFCWYRIDGKGNVELRVTESAPATDWKALYDAPVQSSAESATPVATQPELTPFGEQMAVNEAAWELVRQKADTNMQRCLELAQAAVKAYKESVQRQLGVSDGKA